MQNSIRLSNKKITNLNFIPTEPGIYRFLDSGKQVIYIGKAKHLRKESNLIFQNQKCNPEN